MGFKTVLVYHSPSGRECPAVVRDFAHEAGLNLHEITDREEVVAVVNRQFPAGIVLDTEHDNGTIELCRKLKSDPFSAIVPIVMAVRPGEKALVIEGLESGADDIMPDDMERRERSLRMHLILNRADRYVSVHPTTRLPGTPQIERDINEPKRPCTAAHNERPPSSPRSSSFNSSRNSAEQDEKGSIWSAVLAQRNGWQRSL